jgi:adenine-specific DNA-methyltransferase
MYFPIYVNPQTLRVALERDDDYSVEVLPKKSTGQDGRWMWGREKVRRDNALIQAKLIERRNEYDVFVRDYLERDGKERSRKYKSLWDDKDFNTQNGTQEVKELLQSDAMSFPKPAALLGNIVGMGADDDSLVLDFFAGSGTTAHAVMSANQQDGGCRRFILVQLPEPTGRTDYPTIADITKERVRRVAKRMNKDDGAKDQDRGYRVFKLAESNFKPWDAEASKDGQQLTAQLELHVDHVRDGRSPKDLLFEILLKTGFPLTTPIKTEVIEGKTVFSVADGALLVCLERHLTLELIRALATMKPERVVTLDAGFAGNDPLKTNAVQIFRAAGVTSFKTV